MKITILNSAGFCFGVKRAVNLAEKTLKKECTKIYTLGPLIHNPLEVNRLKKEGIIPVNNPSKLIQKSILLIRTHGITSDLLLKLQKRKIQLIDTTCPFVRRVQQLVKTLSNDNYFVIIIGEKNHPEVKSVVSYAKGPIIVINKSSQINKLPKYSKIAVVSQTTQSQENFNRLILLLKEKYDRMMIFNTICTAATERQKETEEYSKKVELMLIIGGRDSANTRQLVNISSKHVRTYHINSADELKQSWFKNIQQVGISAGASTPEWLIKKVVLKLKKWMN